MINEKILIIEHQSFQVKNVITLLFNWAFKVGYIVNSNNSRNNEKDCKVNFGFFFVLIIIIRISILNEIK